MEKENGREKENAEIYVQFKILLNRLSLAHESNKKPDHFKSLLQHREVTDISIYSVGLRSQECGGDLIFTHPIKHHLHYLR